MRAVWIGTMCAMLVSGITKEDLIGTWSLKTAWAIRTNGERVPLYGEHPQGFLTYTREGRMIAILGASGRKKLSASASQSPVEERAEAFASMLAYAGPFDFDGVQVTHHVEIATYPNYAGTDLVRVAKLEGDRLTLTVQRAGSEQPSAELIWQRVK